MSVFAVGSDAQELLTAVADRAKMAMLIDDTVSRKLTVNFVDRPARRIIGDIARSYGLSAAELNGVMMISEGIPRSAGSYLLSEIDSIPTKYVDAANARNLLPVFLQDYVKVNSEQNSVVLSAPRRRNDTVPADDRPALSNLTLIASAASAKDIPLARHSRKASQCSGGQLICKVSFSRMLARWAEDRPSPGFNFRYAELKVKL